jgi:hypothetical protein
MAADIRFTLSEQDYSEAAQGQFLRRLKRPKKWASMLAILNAWCGLLAYSGSCDFQSFASDFLVLAGIMLFVGLIVLPLIYLWAGRYARRMFRQQMVKPENLMSWNDEGLKIESDLGSMKAKWPHSYGWRKVRRTYMIHMNEALYYVVPGRVLSKEQAADLEGTLIRAGVAER